MDDPIFYQFVVTDEQFEAASARLGMTVDEIVAEKAARMFSVPVRYLLGGDQ